MTSKQISIYNKFVSWNSKFLFNINLNNIITKIEA